MTVSAQADMPTVKGSRAVLHRGVAHAPENAPLAVKQAIWAANELRGMPYKWGGGHGSFRDNGYDCSGSVSYALGLAGLLPSPQDSRSFMNYGGKGRGRWITVYARKGHTFMTIAGLRFDTTGWSGNEAPRWRAEPRSPAGFVARHPQGL